MARFPADAPEEAGHATMRTWRPTFFLKLSVAIHAAAILLLLLKPALWLWALAIVLCDHIAITAAALWPQSTLLGPNVVRLPESAARRGEVAITIDDGPDAEVTPQVLAVLAAFGAKASFFCIGERAAAHPDLCRQIVAAGHCIENHGQLHRKHCSLLGYRGWMREVGTAQETLTAITGRPPRFFRALAGFRNPFLEPALSRLGLHLSSWTHRGFDTCVGDPDRVLSRLTRNLAAGDILVLHDGHSARTPSGGPVIVEVLPQLLANVAMRKLKPVTLASACPPS
jgi:peptidoglycan/xylan/chitin deacetylase (PgdA/CDA1 family)